MTETPVACTETVEQSHPMKFGSKWEDHGGGSFQTMLQVTNLPHANSTKNMFLLSVADCFVYVYYYIQSVCVCVCGYERERQQQ